MDLKKELSKRSKESKFVFLIVSGLLLYLINTSEGALFGTENKILLSIILFIVTLIIWLYFTKD